MSKLRRMGFRKRLYGVPRSLRELDASLALLGRFRELGWHQSLRSSATSGTGQPLPWLTYGATAWLQQRLRPSDKVFEFGCGGSTLWFATLASSVVSVEHDPNWFSRIQRLSPENVSVRLRPSNPASESDANAYQTQLASFPPGTFDVVLVDGVERLGCFLQAIELVSVEGLVLLDNSDRPELAEAHLAASDAGFNQVDFTGFSPGVHASTCTSAFFRDGDRWLKSTGRAPHWGGA